MERSLTVSKCTMTLKWRLLFFAVCVFTVFLAQHVGAQDVKRVAVFPFDVYAEKDAAALREGIESSISAELKKRKDLAIIPGDRYLQQIRGKGIDERLAIATGESIGADYVIIGSLSAIGNLLSLDSKLIDVKQKKALPGIYVQGRGTENVNALSTQLAREISMKISGKERIAGIVFKGNTKIEDNAVLNVMKSAKGKVFTETDLTSDIKAIYKMGYFSDVTADVSDSPEGKIITLLLKERPTVSDILIKGNDKVSTDDIKATLTVKTRQVLNMDKVRTDAAKIKTLYDEKGYFNAEIGYTTEPKGDKEVRLVFNIKENERLYIRSIKFEGNQAFTDKQLKDMMQTSEVTIFRFFTDAGVLKIEKLREDINKLKAFYLNNGYIQAQIGDPDVTHDTKGIYVKIAINEGKQFKVGKVEILGDVLTISREELLTKLKVTQKDYYDRESVIKDIEYLTRMANNDGYAYADVTPRVNPREKEQRVDVAYEIKKGIQVYFNRISISGNTKTRDKVIRRMLAMTEGDLYNSDKMKSSFERLNRTRYFEEVNFQAEKGPQENLTNININVKEKPTGMVSVGGGYSAQEGALLMAQISQNNLFGRGQTLALSGRYGSETNSIELSFTEPWLFDMPLWSKFDIWNLYKEFDTYNLYTKGLAATLGYPIFEKVSGYIGYKFAINNVTDVSEYASTTIKDQEGENTQSGITLTLSRDTTDDAIFPTKGSRNRLSAEEYGTIFGGTVSFGRYVASTSWFFPVLEDYVFNARGRIGYELGYEGQEVPVYERFILGGINSLRGLRDVGPKDPVTGDIIGGTTMFVANFEFLFPLIKNAGMKGVLFYDMGNAWENGYYFDDLRKTAGVGVRWYSPIGPLRLEWGYVLDRKEGESPSRFEFTIGWYM
jgi:outer membrane protein insertion porin family